MKLIDDRSHPEMFDPIDLSRWEFHLRAMFLCMLIPIVILGGRWEGIQTEITSFTRAFPRHRTNSYRWTIQKGWWKVTSNPLICSACVFHGLLSNIENKIKIYLPGHQCCWKTEFEQKNCRVTFLPNEFRSFWRKARRSLFSEEAVEIKGQTWEKYFQYSDMIDCIPLSMSYIIDMRILLGSSNFSLSRCEKWKYRGITPIH